MQIKKNPRADVGRNSSLYFAIGLALMVFLAYGAINYKVYDKSDLDLGKVSLDALDEDEVPKIEAMRAAEGMLINGFEQEGRTFGKAWVFNCSLKKGTNIVDNCAIISPKRTHYKRVVEIISPVFLRDKLNAKDGETFTISVNLGDI